MNSQEKKRNFAENLKNLIYKSGHLQSDVAKYCKIEPKTFSTYCIGRSLPNYDKIKAIADYFNVSVEWMLSDHSPMEVQLTSFQSKFENLTEANRKIIDRMMDVMLAEQENDKKDDSETA